MAKMWAKCNGSIRGYPKSRMGWNWVKAEVNGTELVASMSIERDKQGADILKVQVGRKVGGYLRMVDVDVSDAITLSSLAGMGS